MRERARRKTKQDEKKEGRRREGGGWPVRPYPRGFGLTRAETGEPGRLGHPGHADRRGESRLLVSAGPEPKQKLSALLVPTRSASALAEPTEG